MALRRVPTRDTNSAVTIGTGEHSCKVMLKPIMTNLVQKSIFAAANQLSCANRVRYIKAYTRKWKKKRDVPQPTLIKAPQFLALTELGERAEPLVEVLKGCEESCSQYYVLNNSTYPNTILYGDISSNYWSLLYSRLTSLRLMLSFYILTDSK